ncbi:MAG: hypothetical protein ACKVOQ_14305 [Cyclobacteriaceae bacterium]
MDLSKKDKKIARQIIEKGLQQEFANGLNSFDSILNHWKEQKKDNRDSYHLLYKSLTDFDKHIARRYDRMTGSSYLFIIAGQLSDSVITEHDIMELSQEAQNFINGIGSMQ